MVHCLPADSVQDPACHCNVGRAPRARTAPLVEGKEVGVFQPEQAIYKASSLIYDVSY